MDAVLHLDLLIQRALAIDNRLHRRKQERRGANPSGYPKREEKRSKNVSATNSRPARKGAKGGKKKDLSQVECYNCHRKGHYKNKCPQQEQVSAVRVAPQGIKADRDTHDELTWTACFDNRCQTHLADKQGEGWFPRRPSANEQVATTIVHGDKRFRFWAKVEGIPVRILLDSGSSRDLIRPEFVNRHRLPTTKCKPYALTNFDGTMIGTVDSSTMVNLRIGRRNEKISLDLVPGGVDDITLGIPWLKKAKPSVGWSSMDLTFVDGFTNKVPAGPGK